jgi:hypothetical protein
MMSLAESYRSSLDYREILRILQKSTTLQENFLWQAHALGKNVIPIHHFEIDFVTREVVVYFDSRRFRIDHELPLFVKLDYRTSVFKVAEYNEQQNSVHFSFPKEIKTLELRNFPRIATTPGRELTVALKPSISGSRDTGHELHVRVFDLSQSGLGLIVSEHNRSFLKNNRILWIVEIGKFKLHTPLVAEVVYINNELESRFQNRKLKEMKVGMKLSGLLSPEILNSII